MTFLLIIIILLLAFNLNDKARAELGSFVTKLLGCGVGLVVLLLLGLYVQGWVHEDNMHREQKEARQQAWVEESTRRQAAAQAADRQANAEAAKQSASDRVAVWSSLEETKAVIERAKVRQESELQQTKLYNQLHSSQNPNKSLTFQ